MTIQLSLFSRQGLLNGTGIKEQFTDGIIEMYSGPQPTDANAAVQGTLLMRITVAAGAFTPGSPTNGLEFDAPVAGVIAKAAAETWSGIGLATGTLGWFRLKGNAVDAGAGSNTTSYRIDGSISTSGADLNLSNITIVSGTPITLSAFQFTQPASA